MTRQILVMGVNLLRRDHPSWFGVILEMTSNGQCAEVSTVPGT